MPKYPTLYNVDSFLSQRGHGQERCSRGLSDGRWVEARPECFWYGIVPGIAHRFRLAWLVFTGRCDALEWTEQ